MLFQDMQVHYNELQRGAPLGLRLFPSSWNYRCPDLLFVTRLRLWSGCPVFNDCISLPKSTTLAVRVLHIFNSLHMQSEAFGTPRIIFLLSQTTRVVLLFVFWVFFQRNYYSIWQNLRILNI